MNEELQNRLTKYLDAIESAAGDAGDFVAEQTPLLAQEFLSWVFWGSVTQVVVSLIGITFALLIACLIWRLTNALDDVDRQLLRGLSVAVASILSAVLLGVAADGVSSMVKVSIAPRVVLIEEVSHLLHEDVK